MHDLPHCHSAAISMEAGHSIPAVQCFSFHAWYIASMVQARGSGRLVGRLVFASVTGMWPGLDGDCDGQRVSIGDATCPCYAWLAACLMRSALYIKACALTLEYHSCMCILCHPCCAVSACSCLSATWLPLPASSSQASRTCTRNSRCVHVH